MHYVAVPRHRERITSGGLPSLRAARRSATVGAWLGSGWVTAGVITDHWQGVVLGLATVAFSALATCQWVRQAETTVRRAGSRGRERFDEPPAPLAWASGPGGERAFVAAQRTLAVEAVRQQKQVLDQITRRLRDGDAASDYHLLNDHDQATKELARLRLVLSDLQEERRA